MKRAVIIGASSGIGKELAKVLAKEYDVIALTARRIELLKILDEELDTQTFAVQMDVSKTEDSQQKLNDLIARMGGADLAVICAGTGHLNPELKWKYEKETIDVNVHGFTCMADTIIQYFIKQGFGHLVAISSVAALRGSGICPAYNASKAYVSNYLEGLRLKTSRVSKNIIVTDIKPGFVDTAMAQGDGLFWVASASAAAQQIFRLIKRRKAHGYVTKRWRLVAGVLKLMPRWLYTRLIE